MVNGSQQQYMIRNSRLTHYSNGVRNQLFTGVFGAPQGCDGPKAACAYTTINRTPRSREAPYLESFLAVLIHVGLGGAFRVIIGMYGVGPR